MKRYDTAYNNTRQLDYYKSKGVTTSNYSGAIKQYNNQDFAWWLRAAVANLGSTFWYIDIKGDCDITSVATNEDGVSPAFRIG